MVKKIYLMPLCLLLLAGCNKKELTKDVETTAIVLRVEGLGKTLSRAAVDEWDNTQVSIAYAYAPEMQHDRSLTVTVSDDSGEHINTGMEYPFSGSAVSFIGYHPVAAPVGLGEVFYDISKGDKDIMMSNHISGTKNAPINQKLIFGHLLTRVTFVMQCKPGESYPEPVNGILVSASTPTRLMTMVGLDLNIGEISFKIPGAVFNGTAEGTIIPDPGASGFEPLVFDVMLQPNVPLDFKIVTLTDEKNITITNDPANIWTALTQTTGGEAGKQYTVKLEFSGEAIIGQGITVKDWKGGQVIDNGNGNGTWW